ncbi:MAG: aspartate kinase, partial [Defluviitaleaceae bacterium]|nr:aspartate kinase [Defluviitaleaceae bacterium]
GSDTTAVALACALNAELCEIYTDVDGVYTADPRLVPNAKKLKEIDYDEMLELASLGAKVLHNRCVELSKKYNLPLIVRSSLEFDKEGTIIKGNTMEKTIISGLAVDKDVAQISVIGIKDNTGAAFKLFSLIAKKNIIVDVIVQTIGKGSRKDISFTVKEKDAKETIEILEKNRDFLDFEIINKKTGLLKLSVVGAGMASKPGVSASMFEALYDVGVNIHLISTSEIKISVLIDEEDEKIASNAVHDKLIKGI